MFSRSIPYAKEHVDLHAKGPKLLWDFNKNWNASKHYNTSLQYIILLNSFSSSRVIARSRPDRQTHVYRHADIHG
jgi:hypothetical protein